MIFILENEYYVKFPCPYNIHAYTEPELLEVYSACIYELDNMSYFPEV